MAIGKKYILIIDDEEDLVEALKFQLQKKGGYEVFTASNGMEGLEILKQITPDIIVLDMNMPKMSGIEFFNSICDENYKTPYPILVLTARTNLEELFKKMNVAGFMTKPFGFDELFREIEGIIADKETKDEIARKRFQRKANRVFIVENDAEAFDKIALAFLNGDYVVTTSKTSMDSIEKIINDPPDVVLVSLGMEDLPGDLLVAKLKQMARMKNTILMLYTKHGNTLDVSVAETICRNSGIENIVESNDPQQLLKEVEKVLAERKA